MAPLNFCFGEMWKGISGSNEAPIWWAIPFCWAIPPSSFCLIFLGFPGYRSGFFLWGLSLHKKNLSSQSPPLCRSRSIYHIPLHHMPPHQSSNAFGSSRGAGTLRWIVPSSARRRCMWGTRNRSPKEPKSSVLPPPGSPTALPALA